MSAHRDSTWVRELRNQALAAGWATSKTAEAMHAASHERGQPVSRLAAHRMAHGWTQRQAAEQLADLWPAADRDRGDLLGQLTQLVSRWERGQQPEPDRLDMLCRLYQTSSAALGYPTPDYTPHPDTSTQPDISTRTGRQEVGPGVLPTVADTLPSRRAVVRGLTVAGLAAGMLGGPVTSALAETNQDLAAALETSEVADTTVDRWERQATRYGETYQTTQPLQTVLEIAADVATVRQLRERRQPLAQKLRLTRVLAQLSGLVAILAIDLGDGRAARDWFHTARLAAEDVGDRALRAWVLARESLAPLYEGDLAAAAEQAAAAETLAGAAPSAAAVYGAITKARALAQSGQAVPARRAAERAHAVFGRLGPDSRQDTCFGYTERQLHFHSAQVWTYTGDLDQADEAQRRASGMYSPQEYLDPTLMAFDEALRQITAGDVDAAAQHATDTIMALPDGQRTAIIQARARAVFRALPAGAHRSRTVDTYRTVLALGATN